jgi:hypothetical protein
MAAVKNCLARSVATLATAALLLSCGGDSSDEASDETESPATSPGQEESPAAPEGGASRSDLEACLADAGLDLATGETPTISGVKGIGIGEGPLLPGNISAGVFVYSSESDAEGAKSSLQGAAFPKVEQQGNVVIVYAEPPTSELQTAIQGCTS